MNKETSNERNYKEKGPIKFYFNFSKVSHRL